MRETSMIDECTEATVICDTPKRPKRPSKVPRSTAELLCLLSTYEAYGLGLASSGCLCTLANKGGER